MAAWRVARRCEGEGAFGSYTRERSLRRVGRLMPKRRRLPNDLNRSKAYLRQAFLLDAEKVPVSDLRSSIIRDIRLTTEQEGYRKDVKKWMPVCATYLNIFDVKRELTQDEVDAIEDDCRTLEDQADQDRTLRDGVRPVLIFKYLVLLDHMLVSGRIHDPRLIMYEARLKNLDEDVQRKYFEKVFNHGD